MHLVKLRLEPKSGISRHAVLERFALQQLDPNAWTQQQLERPLTAVLVECTSGKFDFRTFQKLTLYAALEYAVWAFSLTDKLTAHIQAFLDEVDKLHAKAIELGATDEGPPGVRVPDVFYGGYFRDLDGNKAAFFNWGG